MEPNCKAPTRTCRRRQGQRPQGFRSNHDHSREDRLMCLLGTPQILCGISGQPPWTMVLQTSWRIWKGVVRHICVLLWQLIICYPSRSYPGRAPAALGKALLASAKCFLAWVLLCANSCIISFDPQGRVNAYVTEDNSNIYR